MIVQSNALPLCSSQSNFKLKIFCVFRTEHKMNNHLQPSKRRRTGASFKSTFDPPHPLAIRPLGNKYLSTEVDTRQDGLGVLSIIDDEHLIFILGKLSAWEVCIMASVSKFFYALARSEVIWKDLCLDLWEDEPERPRCFYNTWRESFVRANGGELAAPLALRGIYSDILFRFVALRCSSVQLAMHTPETLQ
jgi:hypothetical protein